MVSRTRRQQRDEKKLVFKTLPGDKKKLYIELEDSVIKKKSWYQELEDSLKSEKKLVLRTRRQPKGQKK